MSSLRQGKICSDNSKTVPVSSYVVIDILYHISSFAKVLVAADPLEIIGTENEKAAFVELKSVFVTMMNSVQSESINVQPFLDKLSAWTNIDYCKVEQTDILCVWDDIVKLVMVVIPPLREVFLGQVASAQEVPGWLNLMSRCFHAHFTESNPSLEEVFKTSLQLAASVPTDVHPDSMSAVDRLRSANAMVLRRSPEILIISVESSHLSSRFLSQLAPSGPSAGTSTSSSSKAPSAIRYPTSFDLATIVPSYPSAQSSSQSAVVQEGSRIYDLTTVVALEGANLDVLQAYFRVDGDENIEHWYRGAGFTSEEVAKSRVVEGNFYGGSGDKRVHPRLLVYTRRDLPQVLDRTIQLVSKAGQMRALGDVAFALAMTTENYSEARRCYEEAISLDESLRHTLQENLNSLEKIERTQKARTLEEQADLSLANRRFREASELYSKAMMSAVVGSGVYLRVREKLDSVTKIIGLETACQFSEKGEEQLKQGSLGNAKDCFAQAFKLNPEYQHLHTILVAIEKTVQMQTATQKINEAQQATKAYRYKLANQLYREAIDLVPEKLSTLQATLDNLVPLMQGEDALNKQRAGLAALDDKRFTVAIALFTEAMTLLPHPDSPSTEKATFLADRAQAHYELKDFQRATADCTDALKMRPDLAIAHFRLGASQFALDLYDEASASYDRALKNDISLSEQIKVKVRQVNTAKEIQQRKEREADRERKKEEERKAIEEKKVRDEQARKERAEKLALEQAEKAERVRQKEEERRLKAHKDKEVQLEKEKEKEVEKERLRIERVERDAQKVLERERKQAEKEKERERLKLEKEQKDLAKQQAIEEEQQRLRDFTAEMERAAQRQREAEKEKEAEFERARVERERIIAEREKAREEKLAADAKAKAEIKSSPASGKNGKIAADDSTSTKSKGAASAAMAAAAISAPPASSSSADPPKWSAVAVMAPRLNPAAIIEEEVKNSLAWGASRQAVESAKVPASPVAAGPAIVPATDSLVDFPSLGGGAAGVSVSGAAPSSSSGKEASAWAETMAKRVAAADKAKKAANAHISSGPVDIFSTATEASTSLMDHAVAFKPSAFAEQKAKSLASEQQRGGGGNSNSSSSSSRGGDDELSELLNSPLNGLHLGGGGINSVPSSSSSGLNGGLGNNSSSNHGVSGLYSSFAGLGFGTSDSLSNPNGAGKNSETDLGSSFSEYSVLSALGNLDFEDPLMKAIGGLASSPSNPGLGSLGGPTRTSSRLLDSASSSSSSNNGGNDKGLQHGAAPSSSSILGPLGLDNDISLGAGRGGSLLGSPLDNLPRTDSLGLSLGIGGGLGGSSSGSGMDSFLPFRSSSSSSSGPLSGLNGNFLGGNDPFQQQQQLYPMASSGLGLGLGLGGGIGLGGSASGFVPSSSALGGLGNDLNFFSSPRQGQSSLLGGLGGSGLLSNPLQGLGSSSGAIGAPQYAPLPPQQRMSSFQQPFMQAAASSSSMSGQRHGIEGDLLPDHYFPVVAWLRQYNMAMYRWSGDSSDWLEFAMNLPPDIAPLLLGADGSKVNELQAQSGCKIWIDREVLRGAEALFLVFHRGANGQPSNGNMNLALEIISNRFKQFIQLGLVSSPRMSPTGGVPPPPPPQPASSMQWASAVANGGGGLGLGLGSSSLSSSAIAGGNSGLTAFAPEEDAGKFDYFDFSADSDMQLPIAPGGVDANEWLAAAAARRPPTPRRPEPMKVAPLPGGYLQRALEIPREAVGIIIGQGGKKIKDLCVSSGAKIQFRVNKTAEREGRPGLLEIQGTPDNVDQALQLIWDLLHIVGKEYVEVPVHRK